MKVCNRGVWDESIPGISFDKDGISNFCHFQETMMSEYPRGEQGLEDWQNLVNGMKTKKGKSRYDCIVGVSGGVDSSYLLVILKKAGLNPLAVNLDNGFNSDIAVKNIYSVTKKLNIDLETYVIDYEEIKDLLRSYMLAGVPWIDSPTDLAIKAVMYKYALKENIKFIIRGNDFRSEGKQPKEWTYCDAKQLSYIHKKYGLLKSLKSYPMLNFGKMIYAGAIRKIKDIRPFYYLDYQKQNAKEMLENEFGWIDYGGHHHENLFTKFAMAYWLPKKFNIDKRIVNLSAQILSGAISRDDAMQELESNSATNEELEKLKNYVLKKLNFSVEEFNNLWDSDNKEMFDYPNNYNLVYGIVGKLSPIIKLVYDYKPMSIMHKEFNQKS